MVFRKYVLHEKWQSNQLKIINNKLESIEERYEDIAINISEYEEIVDKLIDLQKDIEDIRYAMDNLQDDGLMSSYPNGITIASKCGEGLGCPPNSEISVLEAKKQGYDVFRINLCKTKDGVYVLSHDNSINREAREKDGTEIVDEIIISEHTYDELNCYDYGIKYGEEYGGLGMSTFEDCVKLAAKCGLKLDIEWKFPEASKEDFESIYEIIVTNGYSNKNWHWITYKYEGVDWFKEICDYVDIEVLISTEHPNWELIEYAQSPNHNVIVGYWESGINKDVILELRKHNVIQNRGTAGSVEAMISDFEHGVTELECCFPYPRKELLDYLYKEGK